MTTVAELAVQLTLEAEDYTKGINDAVEATDEIADSVESAGENVAGLTSEFERTNESINKFMSDFDAARDALKGGNKDLKLSSEQMQKALDFAEGSITTLAEVTGDAAKQTENYAKKTDDAKEASRGFEKTLLGLGKGLLGIATIYTAGRWIANLAEDSIDAAGGMKDLATSSERLKKALGTSFISATEGATGAISDFLDELADNLIVAQATAAALTTIGVAIRTIQVQGPVFDIGVPTIGQPVGVPQIGVDLTQGTIDVGEYFDAYEGGALTIGEVSDKLEDLEETLLNASDAAATDEFIEMFSRMANIPNLNEVPLVMESLAVVTARAAQEARDAQSAYDNFFAVLKGGIGGETEQLILGIKIRELGGDELNAIREQLKQALFLDLDPAIVDELLRDLRAEEIALEVQADIIDEEQAIAEMQKLFDSTRAEAKSLLDDLISGAQDLITLETITDYIDLEPMATALKDAQEFQQTIEELDGMLVELTVDTNYTSSGEPEKPPGFAHGGRVTSGDPFLVGELGPEIFVPSSNGTIIPNGGAVGSVGGRSLNIGEQNFFGVDVDEFGRMAEDERFME